MRPLTIASAVLLAAGSPCSFLAGVAAQPQTAQIYIQPLLGASFSSSPAPLAEITYDLHSSGGVGSDDDGTSTASAAAAGEFASARVTAYEAPEIPESASLVRVGLYDPARGEWIGATSAASVDNFGKGYSPHFLINISPAGAGAATTEEEGHQKKEDLLLLGASLKGVRIDAGQTRDFGPQARLVVASRGKQPELNRPVVLSPEGKKVEKEEKTFLQKYWWMIGIALLLAMGGGGGEGK